MATTEKALHKPQHEGGESSDTMKSMESNSNSTHKCERAEKLDGEGIVELASRVQSVYEGLLDGSETVDDVRYLYAADEIDTSSSWLESAVIERMEITRKAHDMGAITCSLVKSGCIEAHALREVVEHAMSISELPVGSITSLIDSGNVELVGSCLHYLKPEDV